MAFNITTSSFTSIFQLCLCTNEYLRQDILDELENIAEALRTYGNNENEISRSQSNNTSNGTYSYDYTAKDLKSNSRIQGERKAPANVYVYDQKQTQQRLDSEIDREESTAPLANGYAYPSKLTQQRLDTGSNGERKAASNVYIYPSKSTQQRTESGSNGERKAASNVYIYSKKLAQQRFGSEMEKAEKANIRREENGEQFFLFSEINYI